MPELQPILQHSLETLNPYVEDGYYNRWLGAGDFHYTTPVFGVRANVLLGLRFAEGSTVEAVAQFRRPDLWINGYFKVTVYWSPAATDAGNVRFITTTSGLAVGDALSAATTLDATTSVEANGTSNTLYSTEITELTNPITVDYDIISVGINRDSGHGDDTSAQNWWLHGANVEYFPVNYQ
jgi:hypothetical protein